MYLSATTLLLKYDVADNSQNYYANKNDIYQLYL